MAAAFWNLKQAILIYAALTSLISIILSNMLESLNFSGGRKVINHLMKLISGLKRLKNNLENFTDFTVRNYLSWLFIEGLITKTELLNY